MQRQKRKNIKKLWKKKIEINSYDLCRGFPKEFGDFLEICKKLEYEEQPDYEKLRNLLNNIMKRENYIYDYIYDWTTLEEKECRKNNRSKTEPTIEDTLSNNEKEKKIEHNKIMNDNNNSYHIQRNCKCFEKNLLNKESALCCSSAACTIF